MLRSDSAGSCCAAIGPQPAQLDLRARLLVADARGCVLGVVICAALASTRTVCLRAWATCLGSSSSDTAVRFCSSCRPRGWYYDRGRGNGLVVLEHYRGGCGLNKTLDVWAEHVSSVSDSQTSVDNLRTNFSDRLVPCPTCDPSRRHGIDCPRQNGVDVFRLRGKHENDTALYNG